MCTVHPVSLQMNLFQKDSDCRPFCELICPSPSVVCVRLHAYPPNFGFTCLDVEKGFIKCIHNLLGLSWSLN